MQMIAHGLSAAGLFILVGLLQERIHTRDISKMGGFGSIAPKMAAAALIIAMAGMGFPGMANFLGEMLTLIGSYEANAVWTIVATAGLITATVYTLIFFQRPFHGPQSKSWTFSDLNGREVAILSSLVICLLWLGLYPKAAFDTADPALARLQARAASSAQQTAAAEPTE